MLNNLIVWVFVGVVVGWLASRIMPARDGQTFHILLGVVGACATGWFITPLFGISTANEAYFSLPAMLLSLLGAAILVADRQRIADNQNARGTDSACLTLSVWQPTALDTQLAVSR
jgi:uncharacterized membrane protein YeaQ/YmgE (transglycosylase-associated protein family)